MNTKEPLNQIISDELLEAYQVWLKRFHDAKNSIYSVEETPLYFSTVCKLLANDRCINKVNCATCPAARETLVWARNRMITDNILYSDVPYWPAYTPRLGSGIISLTETLNGKHPRMISIEVDDGRYKTRGMRGIVTISVS